jgi:hypothetical protein
MFEVTATDKLHFKGHLGRQRFTQEVLRLQRKALATASCRDLEPVPSQMPVRLRAISACAISGGISQA